MSDVAKSGAAPAAPKVNVEQEVSWLAQRMSEKSTYAGLTVVVSLLLPLIAKYVPGVSGSSAEQIVGYISMAGMGIGGLLAIVFPDKAAAKVAAILALCIFAPFVMSYAHAANTVPLPKPAPASSAPAQSKQQLTAQQVQQNPLVLIQQFTVNDLNNAIALANAQSPVDTSAVACWQALIPVVNAAATVGTPSASGNALQPGVATVIQDARDAQALIASLQSPTGPLAAVNNACAPIVVQLNTTLTLLGVGGGVVAAGGPAAAATATAALGALLAALPIKLPLPLP